MAFNREVLNPLSVKRQAHGHFWGLTLKGLTTKVCPKRFHSFEEQLNTCK